MLTQSTSAIVPPAAVTYKFKVPDLAELFESFSPEQTHVALEGALNIVFGKGQPNAAGLEAEGESEQTEDEDLLDHETQIVGDTTFALFAHQQGLEAEALGITEMVPVDDPENTPLYAQMEENFRAILDKISSDIADDNVNQDVITMYGEMEFFNRLELFTYSYDTKNGILAVTVVATV